MTPPGASGIASLRSRTFRASPWKSGWRTIFLAYVSERVISPPTLTVVVGKKAPVLRHSSAHANGDGEEWKDALLGLAVELRSLVNMRLELVAHLERLIAVKRALHDDAAAEGEQGVDVCERRRGRDGAVGKGELRHGTRVQWRIGGRREQKCKTDKGARCALAYFARVRTRTPHRVGRGR